MESTLRMPTKHVFKNSINEYISCSRNNGTSEQLINLPVGLLELDFNILDLGGFWAIQAIQYKKDAKTINDLVPAVQQVMINCFIQQDNAPSHLKVVDPIFCGAAKQEGFDIRLICQPPNSPDFNILDLGFFRAIQAIQYKKDAKK